MLPPALHVAIGAATTSHAPVVWLHSERGAALDADGCRELADLLVRLGAQLSPASLSAPARPARRRQPRRVEPASAVAHDDDQGDDDTLRQRITTGAANTPLRRMLSA